MEKYVEELKKYLRGRRNISKRLYKFMSTAYRAVKHGRTNWNYVIDILGGAR